MITRISPGRISYQNGRKGGMIIIITMEKRE
jgi:hypothetical protein